MNLNDWTIASQPYKLMGIKANALIGLFLLFLLIVFTKSIFSFVLLIFYLFFMFLSKKHAIPIAQIPSFYFNNYIIGRQRQAYPFLDKRGYTPPKTKPQTKKK